MKAPKFPDCITVILETPANDEPYLQVADVAAVVEPCEAAVYQLLSVGRLEIERRYLPTEDSGLRPAPPPPPDPADDPGRS